MESFCAWKKETSCQIKIEIIGKFDYDNRSNSPSKVEIRQESNVER